MKRSSIDVVLWRLLVLFLVSFIVIVERLEANEVRVFDAKFVSIRGAVLLLPEGDLSNFGGFLLDSGVRLPVVDKSNYNFLLTDGLIEERGHESSEKRLRNILRIPDINDCKVLSEDLVPLSKKFGIRILGVIPLYFPGYEVFLDFGRGNVQWRAFSLTAKEGLKGVSFVRLSFSDETQMPQISVVLNDKFSFIANVDFVKSEVIGLPMGILGNRGLEVKKMKFAYFEGSKEVCYFRLDSIRVGDVRLKNPIGVASVKEKEVWVGTRFWRNFGLGMNYEFGKMYLISSEKDLMDKEWSGVGVLLDDIGQSGWRVGVIEDSPALRNNVQAGDELLLVDGKSVKTFSVEELLRILNGTSGKDVRCVFKDKFSGETKEVILVSEVIL